MGILEHLDKDNLHHAYLIEGALDKIVPEIIKFLKGLGINTVGNPDFICISLDSFRVEDARNLKSYGTQKGFSSAKKIFIISANNFLLEAQNSLLKMFEEPIQNTHFFLIVPDTNALLKTLVSRFYLIKPEIKLGDELEVAEKFIDMSLKNRIDFIKELLITPEEEDEEGNEIITLNSTRSKALKFLNALEFVLHRQSIPRFHLGIGFFEHFFKVREFLRMPGSSTKSLMESVALIIPIY
ncbi:MAG: hypothetical protein AAB902_01210 [Patescibacteria group bacterium]